MYEFHCKYIKRKYNTKVMFPDTDSSVYEIKRGNVYDDFYEDKNLCDFSGYLRDSNFFDPVNKKVISRMKDEFKEEIISQFVRL